MTVTIVRVRREYKQRVVEFVDIKVVCDEDTYPTAVTRATNLVEAQIEAGVDLDWNEESAKPETFPTSPRITGTIITPDEEPVDDTPTPPPAPRPAGASEQGEA